MSDHPPPDAPRTDATLHERMETIELGFGALQERIGDIEKSVKTQGEDARKREERRQKRDEHMSGLLETLADQVSAVVRDHAAQRKLQVEREQTIEAEKGTLREQMLADRKQVNERLDRQDRVLFDQNTQLSAIRTHVEAVGNAAAIIEKDAEERRQNAALQAALSAEKARQQKERDDQMNRIERWAKTTSYVFAACTAIVTAAAWTWHHFH